VQVQSVHKVMKKNSGYLRQSCQKKALSLYIFHISNIKELMEPMIFLTVMKF
jgi:hypothetical protein